MSPRTRWSAVQIVLSLLGAFDAGTVYYADRNSIDLPCTTGGGCSLVAASHWSHLAGFPVALLGACSYVVLALLAVAKLYAESEAVARVASWSTIALSGGATAFSWYLQYVAAVDIGAFCIWCRASAITMSLILVCAGMERAFGLRVRAGTDDGQSYPAAV